MAETPLEKATRLAKELHEKAKKVLDGCDTDPLEFTAEEVQSIIGWTNEADEYVQQILSPTQSPVISAPGTIPLWDEPETAEAYITQCATMAEEAYIEACDPTPDEEYIYVRMYYLHEWLDGYHASLS